MTRAQGCLEVFNSTITGLSTGIHSLPPYIDVGELEERVREYWDAHSRYAEMIRGLVGEERLTLKLSLETDRATLVKLLLLSFFGLVG